MEDENMESTPSTVESSPQVAQTKPMEKTMEKTSSSKGYWVWAVAALIIIAALFFVWKWDSAGYDEQIILIGSCEGCIDLVTPAQGLGYPVTQLAVEDAQKLIEKYEITSVPALLIFTEKELPFQADKVKDAYVIQELPPYKDLATGELKGEVDIMVVQSECVDCFDVEILVDNFAATFPVSSTTYVNATPELIEKYELSVLPVLLVGGDITLYPVTGEYGEFVEDKLVVTSYPPFHDLVTGETLGIVDATYIVDPACETCSVEALEQMFAQVQVTFGKVDTKEKSRATSLIRKYNITTLPTVILSEDLRYYPGILDAWPQLGTIEEDGMFVFRSHELLQMQTSTIE